MAAVWALALQPARLGRRENNINVNLRWLIEGSKNWFRRVLQRASKIDHYQSALKGLLILGCLIIAGKSPGNIPLDNLTQLARYSENIPPQHGQRVPMLSQLRNLITVLPFGNQTWKWTIPPFLSGISKPWLRVDFLSHCKVVPHT